MSRGLGDVYKRQVLVCLANQTGVDLTAALEASFAKKTARDKERHLNNPKLTENKNG